LSKIIKFFGKHRNIDVNDFDVVIPEVIEGEEPVEQPEMTYTTYNINLVEPNENNIDNMSDLSRYEAQFYIEGVEFSTDEITSGKLTSEVIPDVNTK
jgi:hypothetical protein